MQHLKTGGQKLSSFVSASTAAYYDFEGPVTLLDENGPKADNFNADLCEQWEAAAEE